LRTAAFPRHGPPAEPGLRREELAALAGLSIDYYIRLEQGKETNPILTAVVTAKRAFGTVTVHAEDPGAILTTGIFKGQTVATAVASHDAVALPRHRAVLPASGLRQPGRRAQHRDAGSLVPAFDGQYGPVGQQAQADDE